MSPLHESWLRLLSPARWLDIYWPASRKYFFSLICIGIVCSKTLHIYSHATSLSLQRFVLWGPTFVVQDIVCLALAQFLCREYHRRWLRVLALGVTVPASLFVSGLAAANISFYTQTGAEIHWRQAHYFHRDAASIKTLLTGLTGIVIGEAIFVVAAWFLTPFLYNAVRCLVRPFEALFASLYRWKRPSNAKTYEEVPRDDWDTESSNSHSEFEIHEATSTVHKARPSLLLQALVVSITLCVFVLRCFRPSDPAYTFLSQTVVITPFEKLPRSQKSTVNIPDLPGDYNWLHNHTALGAPPKLDWLPSKPLPGFEDWYAARNGTAAEHYNPARDPLKISNLDQDILAPLHDALKNGDVNIKHVFLLKLESTRDDVFPLRSDSYLGNLIRKSYSGKIPAGVEERLANLTRNAERLTGTSGGLHDQAPAKPYGGLHATDAYTGDTFTLKSIVASVCGIAPLVVDFNREYKNHIYEPCLPQIFNALNAVANHTSNQTDPDDYRTWKWRSTFMQSITDDYDNQDRLLPVLGFDRKITDQNITSDWKKKSGPSPEPYNFWGYPERELRSYFRDALKDAEKNHERIFLGHLTGQTHHPWVMPKDIQYEELISSSIFNHNGKINHYLNTIGVADEWLGEILDVLDEAGVANETLIVAVGDHGISLIEDGGVTPYDNPHVSNFHVPLVFAHPRLPPMKVDGRVTSMQILPTMLDLLVESASLDQKAASVIQDLLPLYEGQSMIRELVPEKDGRRDWQFTVMNTGATWLAVRSADQPYRLVIPLVPDVEWRFSNVEIDPRELHTQQSFNLLPLLKEVREVHNEDAAGWIEEAAHVAQWWISENWRRYEYEPEE
ncbi:hypothetical protein N7492_001791 [Penicillium capsulatum]|uniref:Sulfatase N-terminal domain-containing protein n=1 Tax=Penicillium capsulatum TaxID=69766 RepID=A0A9W9ISZ7_9EURO|nr:hypothetical protein N7492_001791 [Penicillium capsulatum]KAJ6129159.1 hypothetical protein N7512_001939 [Penicillium capsulatum]